MTTTPERWRQVSRACHGALARPDAEREGFVRAACGADESQRREVASLRTQPEAATPFLSERPAAPGATLLPGSHLGRYEITGPQSRGLQPGTGLPIDKALPPARQIAEALEYAHEHGVLRGDLTPANVKVTPDGQVKLLDIGLAKALEPAQGLRAQRSRLRQRPV
jgi:hypothetical protein